MKHVKLFESFLNEAARLRGPREWKNDIADELGFDGNEFEDDTDDGYYKVIYDGDTGFEISLYDRRGKKLDTYYFDAEGHGASEIQDKIYYMLDDMRNNL